jgi:hypothetical protein
MVSIDPEEPTALVMLCGPEDHSALCPEGKMVNAIPFGHRAGDCYRMAVLDQRGAADQAEEATDLGAIADRAPSG